MKATVILLLIISTMGLWAQVRNFEKVGQVWKTDLTKHAVELSEFKALLKRDGIPPIDNPSYIAANRAIKVYFEHEPVIVVEYHGAAKAFPLNILTYHEIVNDEIKGLPFSATYCPLCNAAIVFDRRLTHGGKNYVLDFGVSGMLRHSDLVMWDRQTETWWQQFLGKGLVGELTDAELTMLPAQIISLGDFVNTYPNGQVLSRDTGFEKQAKRYGKNVYKGYDSNPNPRLFEGVVDSRLPATERVIDISVGGQSKIYPHTTVAKKKVINDVFNDLPLVLFFRKGTRSVLDAEEISLSKDIGAITVFERKLEGKTLTFVKQGKNFRDKETRSTWSITGKCISGKLKGQKLTPLRYGNHFAFSWFAFRPETEIYEDN